MSEMSTANDGFITAVFGVTPEHAEPVHLKRSFMPWHKPRKQWLRKHQWLHEIEKLRKHVRFSETRPLRYMSLPGTDFLDVRYLHKWCSDNAIPLKFLGYNEPTSTDPNQGEMHLSLAELTQRNYIDRNSVVVPDRLEKISSTTSLAHRRMRENGPFDVINLDLCNSVAACVPLEKQDDCYNAIREMIFYQKTSRTEPWLLFITSRTNRSRVNDIAGKKLFSCIETNVDTSHAFYRKITDELHIDFDRARALYHAGKTAGINNSSFHRLFALGLSKWLLNLLFSGAPKWKLELLPSYDYIVDNARTEPDMISIGFLCSMIIQAPADEAGLTRANPCADAAEPTEPDIAIELLNSFQQLSNVDVLLNSETVKNLMIDEAAELMTDARYDGVAYKAWASN